MSSWRAGSRNLCAGSQCAVAVAAACGKRTDAPRLFSSTALLVGGAAGLGAGLRLFWVSCAARLVAQVTALRAGDAKSQSKCVDAGMALKVLSNVPEGLTLDFVILHDHA